MHSTGMDRIEELRKIAKMLEDSGCPEGATAVRKGIAAVRS